MNVQEREDKNVFINCPFDQDYSGFLDRLIFTIARCGYEPRCARELGDAAATRLVGIAGIMKECRLGVHDLSRTGLDPGSNLPRFNMPLELGVFLGARYFGSGGDSQKKCLVLHTDEHEYKKFLSDLAGSDFEPHGNDFKQLIKKVRDFLNKDALAQGAQPMPGHLKIAEEFDVFEVALELSCENDGHDRTDLQFVDYRTYVRAWLHK
jgi:hypothetical protein